MVHNVCSYKLHHHHFQWRDCPIASHIGDIHDVVNNQVSGAAGFEVSEQIELVDILIWMVRSPHPMVVRRLIG